MTLEDSFQVFLQKRITELVIEIETSNLIVEVILNSSFAHSLILIDA